ncbi:hypothetical protein ACGFNF_27600 [Micromonospora sp. NPDC048868]|uniref:hypothetical protein n=1 Tax=Micromonospora sp. NPDC048868 TaxID=3364258 RepID=UPI00371206DB
MPSAASVDPFWSVTLRSLRELTRLAVAALVLAVGLGGATAASAPAPFAAGPTAVTAPVPAAVTAAVPAGASAPLTPPLSRREPVAEQADGFAAPPAVRHDDTLADAAAVAVARPDGPAREPGRGVPARRGPPAA